MNNEPTVGQYLGAGLLITLILFGEGLTELIFWMLT